MNTTVHALASAAVGGGLFFYTRSVTAGVICFFSGFLVDIDHLFDYWSNYGLRFGVGHFFYVFREEPLRKIFVLFHAWEWVFLLLILALWSNWNPVATGLLFGFGNHLLLDHFFNKHSLLAYSFVYRLLVNFKGSKFHGPEEHSRRAVEGGRGENNK